MYRPFINQNLAFPPSSILKYFTLNIYKPLTAQMPLLIAACFSVAISLSEHQQQGLGTIQACISEERILWEFLSKGRSKQMLHLLPSQFLLDFGRMWQQEIFLKILKTQVPKRNSILGETLEKSFFFFEKKRAHENGTPTGR